MFAEWGYSKSNGPETWAKRFPMAAGSRQSPVNIETARAITNVPKSDMAPLRFKYTTDNCKTLVNTGYGWKVDCSGTGTELTGGPLRCKYTLEQFHCHWGPTEATGSEHTVDGKSYAGEPLTAMPSTGVPASAPRKPPAIEVHLTAMAFKDIEAITKTCSKGPVRFTFQPRSFKIHLTTDADYQLVKNGLAAADKPFNSFGTRAEQAVKVILRGLPAVITAAEIGQDLQHQGLSPLKVNSEVVMPTRLVSFAPGSVSLKLLQQRVRSVRQCDARWDSFRSSRIVTQCYRCQKFGHGSRHCHGVARCVKCGAEHDSRLCPVSKEVPATCCNCNGTHTACNRACSMYKEYVERRTRHQQPRQPQPPQPASSQHRLAIPPTPNPWKTQLHLVHWNSDKYPSFAEAAKHPDGLAVLAVFLKVGKGHSELLKITALLNKIVYKSERVDLNTLIAIDIEKLLPSTFNFWTYPGSLTTPPCSETVDWLILKEPVEVSKEQLAVFRRLRAYCREQQCPANDELNGHIVHNYRPTLSLGNREIRECGGH